MEEYANKQVLNSNVFAKIPDTLELYAILVRTRMIRFYQFNAESNFFLQRFIQPPAKLSVIRIQQIRKLMSLSILTEADLWTL